MCTMMYTSVCSMAGDMKYKTCVDNRLYTDVNKKHLTQNHCFHSNGIKYWSFTYCLFMLSLGEVENDFI